MTAEPEIRTFLRPGPRLTARQWDGTLVGAIELARWALGDDLESVTIVVESETIEIVGGYRRLELAVGDWIGKNGLGATVIETEEIESRGWVEVDPDPCPHCGL